MTLPNMLSAAEVRGLRMWPAPDNTRLVFDLNAPVEHSLFTLRNPDRIVIDLQNTKVSGALPSTAYNESRLKGIRYAKRGNNGLRVVLDLKNAVKPKSFVLKPHGAFGIAWWWIYLMQKKAKKLPLKDRLTKQINELET